MAQEYARLRPGYPDALFDHLAALAPHRRTAWDCATGNGQAARQLAARFAAVVATDASSEQLARATPHPRITYRCATAEASGLDDGEIALVTVAQALHWLDLDRFYAEAARVLAADGVLAAWTYRRLRIEPAVDAVVDRFYHRVVGPFWPPERRHVEDGYRSLPWPFPELEPPAVELAADWDLEHLIGYLGTWSASRRYRESRRRDPVAEIRQPLTRAWGDDPLRCRRVVWPLTIRIGRRP